jgi:tetratricopeptide (TPR) repeat protein
VLPIVTFAADRFLYLSMVGVAFVFCSALIEKPRLQPIALAVLLALGALSVRRAADWKSDLTLWQASLRADDKNAFAWACYGTALLRESRLDEAEEALKTALKNRPTVGLAHGVLPLLERLAARHGRNDKMPDRL